MEIKPQELRIGNLVSWNKEPCTAQSIRGKDIGLYDQNKALICTTTDLIKGIDLTPEWLEKFGFKHGAVKHDFMWKHPKDDNKVKELFHFININHDKDAPFITVEMGNDHGQYCDQPIQHIKYVHQLQNLYFALTGKELAIDNKSI